MINKIKSGCRVGFFGLGSSNLSLLSHLPLENCAITIRSDAKIDRRVLPGDLHYEGFYECEFSTKEICEDILFFSPSVRRDRRDFLNAQDRGVEFSSDAEIFFSQNKKKVIAITGSDGKSTTAALCAELLNGVNRRSILCGNIGQPMSETLGFTGEFAVCELSSFMLFYHTPNSARAAITCLTPNHLDWHRDFEEYKKTKLGLLNKSEQYVTNPKVGYLDGAFAIVGGDDGIKVFNPSLSVRIEDGFITKNGRKVIEISEIKRNENHNLKNLMTAIALTEGMVSDEDIYRVAKSFSGLSHRCEKFFSSEGVLCYDSAIDTSPSRTVQTLSSIGRPAVVILGGRSKGLDYSILCPALEKYATDVIICGENAGEIGSQITERVRCRIVEDFDNGVLLAHRLAKKTGCLILSPASSSYDAFKSYEKKGERFKFLLNNLS